MVARGLHVMPDMVQAADRHDIPVFVTDVMTSQFAGALTWLTFLWKNLLPVTIGNIIGGAVFVGMSYWGAYLKPIKTSKPLPQ